jgi:hypothetical protein
MTDLGAIILIIVGFVMLKLFAEALGSTLWP